MVPVAVTGDRISNALIVGSARYSTLTSYTVVVPKEETATSMGPSEKSRTEPDSGVTVAPSEFSNSTVS